MAEEKTALRQAQGRRHRGVIVEQAKKTALVIAPGRGTYAKGELGYLARHHATRADIIARFDAVRTAKGQPTLTELDGADRFSNSLHLRGDVAAPLIFAASYLDCLAINRDRFDIVAVTGNSMGWYSALACAGAVSGDDGFAIADAMGVNSQSHGPGGQLVVTIVDDDWREVPGLRSAIMLLCDDISVRMGHRAALSIDLGGMLVLAGNEAGMKALAAELPPTPGRAPLPLAGHGPFHTPLMGDSAARARAGLPATMFGNAAVPLVDGRGQVWRRIGHAAYKMWDYTFGHQILAAYDFTRAVQVAVREFAPDRIILLGPGETLGGAIAQALIAIGWRGLSCKQDFIEQQAKDPWLINMGREGQRELVI
jgi:[acyl-carrier-protein] S-malonyltransferase